MNNDKILKCLDELASELPWVNGIADGESYQQALACLSALKAEGKAQPFIIKLVTALLSEFEANHNEQLLVNAESNKIDTGVAALITLMNHRKIRSVDLVDVLGGKSLVSQIINGKRALTISHIYTLAKFFNVKPSVFL